MRGPEKLLCSGITARVYLLVLLCFFVLQGPWCAIVWAKAVPSSLAQEVVNGWLAKEAKPMGSQLGSEVENVETFTDSNGQPVYHVVYLKPDGFVIVSGDDLVEPIVCFSSEGSYDSSQRNPLGALVSRDIPARVNASRSVHAKLLAGSPKAELTKQEAGVHKSGEKAFGKWTELLGSGDGYSVSAAFKKSISDVRVAPLLSTKWGQFFDAGCYKACFNYYTPPYGDGVASNYPAGCVATAMAQYMRFWQYPSSGVGTQGFTIYVDGSDWTANLRGGDGFGGAYNWSQMPYVPGCGTTIVQRKAIGALIYDAGVAVGMDYWSLSNGGSSASVNDVATAMVDTFGYSNVILGSNYSSDIGAGLNAMVNPNLDSGNPVILGIFSYDSYLGHAVVADGYGYQSSTLYHHLNMGWYGAYNVWYNLPNIDASPYSFDSVDAAIYNIYVSGTGEIISGRIMAPGSQLPVSGATVTAVKSGGETYQATTNTKGIYALAKVSSNSTYTISVAKSGYSFADRVTSTGLSQDNKATSGNCWAIDFVSAAMVGKCTVTAGKNNIGAISLSGTLNATTDDILAAGEIVVDINSANMVNHFVQAFQINPTTFKNGKFNCTIPNNPSKVSFAFDTKTSKFSFMASNVNLSGLSCPLEIEVDIAGFGANTDIDETIVNGTKPIPINFLMGVKDSLRVDKSKFTRDKNTGNITQVAVSGGFSVEDINDANLVTNQLDITIGSQPFTIPGEKFKFSKGKFSCSKVLLPNGEIAAATFDFNKCTFTLTIKGTKITDAAGAADFNMEFGDFSEGAEVSLP